MTFFYCSTAAESGCYCLRMTFISNSTAAKQLLVPVNDIFF
jgi:hypothetical protein